MGFEPQLTVIWQEWALLPATQTKTVIPFCLRQAIICFFLRIFLFVNITTSLSKPVELLAIVSNSDICRLVQAYRPKVCPPRMPIATSTQVSHAWYPRNDNEQRKRVTSPFLFSNLGLVLAAKLCLDGPQAFKRSTIVRCFRKKIFVFQTFFWTNRFVCTTFRPNMTA